MPYRTYEELMPVAEYGWEPTEDQVRAQALTTIQDLGFYGQLAITGVRFQEFDSSNPHHACGYWDVTVSGSERNLDDFVNAIEA